MGTHDIITNSIPNADISIQRGFVFNYPTHTHSHYEMTLYTQFNGAIIINGEVIKIKNPTVVLVSPSDFHRILVDNENNASLFTKIGFYEKVIKNSSYTLPEHPIILENANSHPLIINLFEEIYCAKIDNDYLTVLIQAAMLYIIKHGKSIKPAPSGKKHELVINVLRYVNQNFTSDITLNSTADNFSVSSQYLSSVFSDEVGLGFSAYITDLRLKLAADLLKTSDRNITEICYDCGYRNLSHFLRSFRQMYNMSPKEYKKRN